MAFRQHAGPAASTRQVRQLQTLLEDAGYDDFRSARGPLGLSQRQGLGKFTNAEADELIDRLTRDADEGLPVDVEPSPATQATRGPLHDTPTELLVAELRARGFTLSDS